MDYLLPLEVIRSHTLVFRNDSAVNLEKLRRQLLGMGYEGNAQAEVPGQFSVRGGIIDIFPLTLDNPVRIELWGDEIDSIRSFDPESQRSIENLEEVTIYPAAEMVLEHSRLFSSRFPRRRIVLYALLQNLSSAQMNFLTDFFFPFPAIPLYQ